MRSFFNLHEWILRERTAAQSPEGVMRDKERVKVRSRNVSLNSFFSFFGDISFARLRLGKCSVFTPRQLFHVGKSPILLVSRVSHLHVFRFSIV